MRDNEPVIPNPGEGATRWYVPAYKAQTGKVIPCGTQTVIEEHARNSAQMLNEIWQDTVGSPEVFIAFQDLPDWQRLDREPA